MTDHEKTSGHPPMKITEACHCGQPVTYGYDGHPNHHRGMCAHCDPLRCDVDPGVCRPLPTEAGGTCACTMVHPGQSCIPVPGGGFLIGPSEAIDQISFAEAEETSGLDQEGTDPLRVAPEALADEYETAAVRLSKCNALVPNGKRAVYLRARDDIRGLLEAHPERPDAAVAEVWTCAVCVDSDGFRCDGCGTFRARGTLR